MWTSANHFLSKILSFFDSRNCKCLPFSLLRNLITHLSVNVLSKVWRNKKTFQFCQAHQATAHLWLIVCNGSANQITAFALVFQENSTNCDHNFKPCGIFEKMASFTQPLNQDLEQGKSVVAINSQKLRSKKTRLLKSITYWNLARSLGKTYCERKCKTNKYQEFHHSGTLTGWLG